LCDLTHAM